MASRMIRLDVRALLTQLLPEIGPFLDRQTLLRRVIGLFVLGLDLSPRRRFESLAQLDTPLLGRRGCRRCVRAGRRLRSHAD